MTDREIIYVVGAGFSAGLGYPLTRNLLVQVWERLDESLQDRLERVIDFHHPGFNRNRSTSFPEIEQLLTQIDVNLDLFDASRSADGTFRSSDLKEVRSELLTEIGSWFHSIYKQADRPWLDKLVNHLKSPKSAVISFNWDLVLDHRLFPDGLSAEGYGLGKTNHKAALLLKPHGSLNWYRKKDVRKVVKDRHVTIFENEIEGEAVDAFLLPRDIYSKSGREYSPLIIPPTLSKDFGPAIFKHIWKQCTDILSTAKRIIFLGYSMPSADLQAQFIFRSAYHNQLQRRVRNDASRHPPIEAARVTVVNPDHDSASRIERNAGQKVTCRWVPLLVEEWVEKRTARM